MGRKKWQWHRPYIHLEDRLHNGGSYKSESHNRHHIISRSLWGNNHSNNIITIKETVHDSINGLFGNWWPKEQQQQLLLINHTALSNLVKEKLYELIDIDDKYRYKDGVRRSK